MIYKCDSCKHQVIDCECIMFSKETLRFYDATTKPVVNYGWKQYLKPEEQTLKYHNGTQQTFKNGEFEPK